MMTQNPKQAFDSAVASAQKGMRDAIDQMYDASVEAFGTPIGLAVFDQRVLYPVDVIPAHVKDESGEDLDESRVNGLAERGWFSLLVSDYTGERATGVPQYVIARIGLFLQLEKRGYSDSELGAFAEFEDGMVEDLYAAGDLAYEDDDLKLLLTFYREQEEMLANTLRVIDEPEWRPDEGSYRIGSDRGEVETELAAVRKRLGRYEAYKEFGIPSDREDVVGRAAFRVRYVNEFVRITSIEPERLQFAAGYSFFIEFEDKSRTWPQDEFVAPGPIDWEPTWRRPWAAEADPEIIRLPGLLIENGEPRLLGSPSPARYQELWRQYDLDAFYHARAAVREQAVCLHCFGPLPDPIRPSRRYCSEACRNSARQKRYRERHPMRDLDNKRRYYSSLPENLRDRDRGQD